MLKRDGWDRYFTHSTGHGLGLEIHELPSLSASRGDTTLQPREVFTVEPGIYIPGEWGIRVEDIVCVGRRQSRTLNTVAHTLIEL